MHANKREELASRRRPATSCAVMGLKQTTTGDTLSDPAHPIVLESMNFPDPVISVAIEPKTKGDQEKLGTAIQKLAEEDPTFKVHNDEETGQTVIAGMGELHLDILVDRMRREFNVEANIGKPQVAYRETIRGTVEKYNYVHKKQTGGSGQYAKIQITVEPLDMTASGECHLRVRQRRHRWSHPEGVHPLGGRRCAGRPAVRHPGRLPGARRQADPGRRCLPRGRLVRNGVQDRRLDRDEGSRCGMAKPVLLEPMMSVEVVTPEENMGDVIGDLNSRRGQIQAMDERGGARVVRALVPLSEMFGYVGDLRSRDPGPGVVLDGVRLLR